MFKGKHIVGIIVLYKHMFQLIIISTQKHVYGTYKKVNGRILLMHINNIYSLRETRNTPVIFTFKKCVI